MTPTSVQLWERIHSSGLATPEECRKWAIDVSSSGADASLHDSRKLAMELIRLGRISSFQANVLYDNLPIPIAIGTHRLSESLEATLGPNWFLAKDISRSSQPSRWCYLLTPSTLIQNEFRQCPPSVELAQKQVAIQHPSIDRWRSAGVDNSNIIAFCDALDGNSLSERLADRPLEWSVSVSMMEQIAAGLQKMHDAGLVHGCISTDSIWCVDDVEFVLRRDPLFPPQNPYSIMGVSVLPGVESTLLSVAAPELTLPNSSPSVQSDLYALGCLWYRSLTGGSPFQTAAEMGTQDWAKTHTSQPFRPIAPSILPGPLQSCLAHLLAKNPSARFASAMDLVKAIEFAVGQSETRKMETILPKEQSLESAASVSSPTSGASPAHNKPQVAPKLETGPASPQNVSKAPLPNEDPQRAAVQSVKATAPTQAKKKPANLASTGKKKSKKKKKPVWLMPSIMIGSCILLGIVGTALVRNGTNKVPVAVKSDLPDKAATSANATNLQPNSTQLTTSEKQPIAKSNGNSNNATSNVNSVTEFYGVEPDNGQLLWAPPHAGTPFSLEMFPAGLEALAFFSNTVWHQRGVSAPIGKWWIEAQPEITKVLSAVPLLADQRVSSVAVALYPSKKPGVPHAVYRLSFMQPVSIDSITAACPGYSMQLIDPKSVEKRGIWSNESTSNAIAIAMDGLQTDGAAMVNRVVVGPVELIATLPELNGGSAPLRRQLETLLKSTDSRCDLTVLFAPSFVFGDGRELLAFAPAAFETLRNAIDESMQAVVFATTLEPKWYMELRLLSSETRDAGKFASTLKSTLGDVADSFEKNMSSGMELQSYWRALGLRYPQMMRTLIRYGRIGLEDGQVVANAYLPTEAISNIGIASWMAIQSPNKKSVASSSIDAKPSIASATKPIIGSTIEQLLESSISLNFEQESLENALQLIASESADSAPSGNSINMAINGTAFQKEGITRNQQIRAFKQEGVPLRKVLTDLVRRANPVTTVQSPTERNQKVVWLILDDLEKPGQKKIELTTRIWAEVNKVPLPKEFVAE